MKESLYAYVFFTTGKVPGAPLRFRAASWAIRFLTRSRFAHCGFGFDGAFIDGTFCGVKFWPQHAMEFYPSLVAMFRVPIRTDPSSLMAGYGAWALRPVSALGILRRWLLGGDSYFEHDCMGVTLTCMRAGGVRVPRHVRNPQHLYDYLVRRNFPHVSKCPQIGRGEAAFRAALGRWLAD